MEIRLSEGEIREILADAIAKRSDYKYIPAPDDCWFEVETVEIGGGCGVKFCCNVGDR